MTTLLHISASPRGERSESLAIAATFLDELRSAHPDVTVEHWDLDPSVPFAAKLAGGLSLLFWLAVVFFGRAIGFTLGIFY